MTMGTEIRTLDKMLGAIDPEDAVFVLKRLVQGNSALEQKTKKIIEELLSSIDPENISTDLFYKLNSIDVQDLWDHSGRTRYGYVDPTDKAWEMFEEVIEPYLDKMKKSQELHMGLESNNYCLGIIQGLQEYARASTSEFSDWIPNGPSEFIDTVITEWKKGNPDQERSGAC